jgi:16S rRNA (guanine1207-N2)-methyltransferase
MQNPSYELKLKSKTDRGQQIYEFVSADGVASKDSFRDAELALADNVELESDDDVLVVQGGYGFLGVILADQAQKGETLMAETSDRAYQLTKQNLKENNIKNASCRKVSFYSEIDQSFDKVVYAPKGYEPVEVVKNRISNSIQLLEQEGELFVAGKKTDGINRYKSQLNSMPGNTEKIAQDGKQRVYKYTKTEDFEPEKFDVETNFEAEIKDEKLSFAACEGLFSPKELDEGSRLLIQNTELSDGEEVLDLACGYGIIGIFLQKLYGVNIHLTDDNKTATYYAKKNLESNSVQDYELKNKDCIDGFTDKKFDVIVSNPPTHQGSGVTDEMFQQAHKSLKRGGKLYLVYNQNMGFEDQLSEMFDTTEILEEKDNYRVLKAVK